MFSFFFGVARQHSVSNHIGGGSRNESMAHAYLELEHPGHGICRNEDFLVR